FHLKDSVGRTWQCGTIQLDFAQPENFDLEYVTPEGTKERPVMIHRTIYGSLERFLGIPSEHYAGEFPVWLAPVQVVVIPISERHTKYARDVVAGLVPASEKATTRVATTNIRVEVDDRDETMQAKIRDAQLQKIPYMLVVGDREVEKNEVSVRLRSGEDLKSMPLEKFIERISEIINSKSLEL
ncbi:His/Gly/Thr/Pro-type tRNA ligase C-terminal domain-containing protein, partial [Candidatus Parcubacteria bacterium]|nr:His/Gly/Thr/Pro-type tRNA ligase C-terminal domain-containing protein [Candidatus Parcubacteria bacterium]